MYILIYMYIYIYLCTYVFQFTYTYKHNLYTHAHPHTKIVARSMHPSESGSRCSQACSEATIGAGDATEYWDYSHRVTTQAGLCTHT